MNGEYMKLYRLKEKKCKRWMEMIYVWNYISILLDICTGMRTEGVDNIVL